MRHSTTTDNHVPYAWTYANAAARTGASGFVTGDIGKFARQTDDDSMWMLISTTPTWIAVGGGGGTSQHDIDSATYHNGVSGAVEDNLMSFDSNGLPQDCGYNAAELMGDATAILHDIDDPLMHNGVSGATENNFLSFDSNGLPKDSSYAASSFANASHSHGVGDLPSTVALTTSDQTCNGGWTFETISPQFAISPLFHNNVIWLAKNSVGGTENVMWPRASDDNTYINYGSGGYLYIRDNSANNRARFYDNGLQIYRDASWQDVGLDNDLHDRVHGIDDVSDHTGVDSFVEDNLLSFNSSGLPQDSGFSAADLSGGGDSTAADSAMVQARRTTAYTLTTGYVDLTFDATDEETDDTILEHNDTNTERIDIKEDGTYLILYDIGVDAPSAAWTAADAQAQLEKNGSAVLSGSWSRATTFNDDSIDGDPLIRCHLGSSVVETLSSGDYVTLQLKYVGDVTDTEVDGTLKIIKLAGAGAQGEQGEPGAPGSGSSIIVKDEGVDVDNTPHTTLDFVGDGVSVSDSTSGAVVTIAGGSSSVFGTEYDYAESEGQSSTTSDTYQEKLSLSTGVLPAGTYRIGWSFGYASTQNRTDCGFKIEIDDTTTINEFTPAPTKKSTEGAWYALAGFQHVSLTNAAHTIDIDYLANADGQGGTTYILNARLEIWRVE